MRKRSSDFENRIKELQAKYEQIAYKIPRSKRKSSHQIVHENLVENFVKALTDSKVLSSKMQRTFAGESPMLKTKKTDPADINFVALNTSALNFMNAILKKTDATDSELREAIEYGRQIVEQLHDNIKAIQAVVVYLPAEQGKEVYNNIFKVVEVIERLEEKFNYSKLPDIEKKLYDIDKNLDDLKKKFGALVEEEGLDAVEAEINKISHPYLAAYAKNIPLDAQKLSEDVKTKLSFLKDLLKMYQADKASEPKSYQFRQETERKTHQNMKEWVKDATFTVQENISGLRGIKKNDETPSPEIPKKD